jgi:hypothetical protein
MDFRFMVSKSGAGNCFQLHENQGDSQTHLGHDDLIRLDQSNS